MREFLADAIYSVGVTLMLLTASLMIVALVGAALGLEIGA